MSSSLVLHPYLSLKNISLSGTVEFDLIFPKNGDVYEPTAMMPLVWAIQNANLAATLDAIISITLNGGYADDLQLHLTPANLTGRDVYYAYTYSDKFNVEGSFDINWYLYFKNENCSRGIYYDDVDSDFHGFADISLSTKHGAPLADIMAAQASNCSNTQNVSFNITGTEYLNVFRRSEHGIDVNSTANKCALLSPTPPALDAGKPCNVKVDAAAAASITASLQTAVLHDQCTDFFGLPNPSCPSKNAAEGLRSQSWRKISALVFLAAAAAMACV
ncbi:hypothetical protein NQ176_g2846 [Zarea fungicola]|uniref:Uncharacterized protein n=1 Tax=Zarea fungicola TaxID=93591 RepID=A0ACC1NLZ6_9HYPO|nr:hypothetical protein NQ176_g2846 [Lecanicillium fungicola]